MGHDDNNKEALVEEAMTKTTMTSCGTLSLDDNSDKVNNNNNNNNHTKLRRKSSTKINFNPNKV